MEKLIKRLGVLVLSIIAITLVSSQEVKAGVNVEVDGTTAVVSWDGEGKAEIVGETSLTSFEVHTILDEVSDKVENVIIDKSIKTIGDNAFHGCGNLKSITIPNSVKFIEKDAFKFCDEITIKCKKNSYAHKYAKKNKIKYKIIK